MEIETLVILGTVLGIIVVFFAKGIYDQRRNRILFRQQLKKNYGKYPTREYSPEQYASIARYYEKNRKSYAIDEITWNDLDMDSVFQQMNHTYSSAGEEYLFYRLHTPEQTGDRQMTDEKLIRYFMEIRGIGLIDARHMFGIGAVKPDQVIDLVVHFEPWDENKVYDRLGNETQFTEILGVRIPYFVVPVRPGRNLAAILELAAMNNRERKMGYNAAQVLVERHDRMVDEG